MRKGVSSNNLITRSKVQLSWGSTVQLAHKLRGIDRIYFRLWYLLEIIWKYIINDYISSIVVIRKWQKFLSAKQRHLLHTSDDGLRCPKRKRNRSTWLPPYTKKVYETWVHTTAASIYFHVLISSNDLMFWTPARLMENGFFVFFLFLPLFCRNWFLLFNMLRLNGHIIQHYFLVYWINVVEDSCWRIK
jgi:hypothetical protein